MTVFRNEKFIVPAPKTRGKGWTVYGAVSTCLRYRNSYFEIGKSTNKIEFSSFIENLAKQVKAEHREPKPLLVLSTALIMILVFSAIFFTHYLVVGHPLVKVRDGHLLCVFDAHMQAISQR